MPMYTGYGLPKTVKTLLIANAAVFVVTTLLGPVGNALMYLFGLIPELTLFRLHIWQPFTYMFLHGSLGHIFLNMFALWMFGTELEYNWGSRDFFVYYVTCGIGGALLVIVTSYLGVTSPGSVTIGASGAVFGLLVAYGLMWPDRMIFIFGILPMKALHFVIIFGAMDLLRGLRGGGRIAYFAHIGGGVTGFLYLKYGWRLMVQFEAMRKRAGRGKFTVVQGGKPDGQARPGSRDDEVSHPDRDEEVDRILDKIARDGMDSLTARERTILDRASNRKRK
jgi:membrane associated rhomboid family serine protease